MTRGLVVLMTSALPHRADRSGSSRRRHRGHRRRPTLPSSSSTTSSSSYPTARLGTFRSEDIVALVTEQTGIAAHKAGILGNEFLRRFTLTRSARHLGHACRGRGRPSGRQAGDLDGKPAGEISLAVMRDAFRTRKLI